MICRLSYVAHMSRSLIYVTKENFTFFEKMLHFLAIFIDFYVLFARVPVIVIYFVIYFVEEISTDSLHVCDYPSLFVLGYSNRTGDFITLLKKSVSNSAKKSIK